VTKFYGSRFCQQCGRLFEVTEPGGQTCASCEQRPAEPVMARAVTVTVVPMASPPEVTPRPAVRPKVTARPPGVQPRRVHLRDPRFVHVTRAYCGQSGPVLDGAQVTEIPAEATCKTCITARHRPARRERPAPGPRRAPVVAKNSGPVTGPRTLPMLRALAGAPAGLTTPQLAEFASSASSWVNALGTTRQLMLKQERLGRVRQAGTVDGDRTRGSALWRITEEGVRYARERG
jgi:hypothetical protein